MRSLRKLSVLVALAGLGTVPAAEAGLWKNVVLGLDQAGFVFDGQRNPLSGGADLIISRTFNDQIFDFGSTELSLTGTPEFSITTGGRQLQTLDFSLNTNDAPLTYTLTSDTGNQQLTIDGSLFLNATAKLNSLGFYDMELIVSSRQTITEEGRVDQEPVEQDFNLGPINLRGNLFADLLASVTDPIFQALGIENIFAQYSGAGQIEDILGDAIAKAEAKARAGQKLSADEIAHLGSVSAMGAAFGLQVPDLSFLDDVTLDDSAGQSAPITAIPEPASLVLVGLGAAMLLRRRR